MGRLHGIVGTGVVGMGIAASGCFSSSEPGDAGLDLALDASASDGDASGSGASDSSVPDRDASGDGASFDGSAIDGETPASGDASGPCMPTGAPIMHTTDIAADETWASGIHVLPGSIQVTGGARLTVAPCSAVLLGTGASLDVTAAAAGLDAIGTASAPIRFDQLSSGMSWGAIQVRAPAVAHLEHVTVFGGGTGPHASVPFGGASLAGLASGTSRPTIFELVSVRVDMSAGLGIFLDGASFDPASTDLTITGSGWYPLFMGAASAGSLPVGTFTGNAIDQILLQTFGVAAYDDDAPLASDVTIHDPGVPYRVGTAPSSIRVGDGVFGDPSATLTLAAGVHLLFTPQGSGDTSQLAVDGADDNGTYVAQGALVVQGTSAAPVVLDSAADAPAAGDWQGIFLHETADSATAIDHARILHAGGASGYVGTCGSTPAASGGAATCAVLISADTAPAELLTNSDIEASSCGVYRGWPSGDVDFTASNTFVGVPGCTQTTLPAPGGGCAPCASSP
jgi:hypothetical protein